MGHQLRGPTALLQCNMTYMRCSVSHVKGILLQCIINKSFTFQREMSAPNNPKFDRLTFPKYR